MKGNGKQFLKIYLFIKSLKQYNFRLYLFCLHVWSRAATLHSSTPLYLNPLYELLLTDRYLTNLTVYIHNRVWIQNVPHIFQLYYFIVKPLENQCLCFNNSLDFFIFCIVLPKKGIFYEHTSTSFVIDGANTHDHILTCQF